MSVHEGVEYVWLVIEHKTAEERGRRVPCSVHYEARLDWESANAARKALILGGANADKTEVLAVPCAMSRRENSTEYGALLAVEKAARAMFSMYREPEPGAGRRKLDDALSHLNVVRSAMTAMAQASPETCPPGSYAADLAGACLHPNNAIHPGRFDGTHTVCIRCHRMIALMPTQYMDGKAPEVQFQEALTRLGP